MCPSQSTWGSWISEGSGGSQEATAVLQQETRRLGPAGERWTEPCCPGRAERLPEESRVGERSECSGPSCRQSRGGMLSDLEGCPPPPPGLSSPMAQESPGGARGLALNLLYEGAIPAKPVSDVPPGGRVVCPCGGGLETATLPASAPLAWPLQALTARGSAGASSPRPHVSASRPSWAGQSAWGQHASPIYRWPKQSGSCVVFRHELDGTPDPRARVCVCGQPCPAPSSCSRRPSRAGPQRVPKTGGAEGLHGHVTAQGGA